MELFDNSFVKEFMINDKSYKTRQCKYLSNFNIIKHNVVCIIVVGLNENPFVDVWIKIYFDTLCKLNYGVIIINPHWKKLDNNEDDVNSIHYQLQLNNIFEELFKTCKLEKINLTINFISFSQGGCQTIYFMLKSPIIHNIIHNCNTYMNINKIILLDPYPPDDNIYEIQCPYLKNNILSMKCISKIMDRTLIFTVDGKSPYEIERLPIGKWTAEILKIDVAKLNNFIQIDNINHSDIPLNVLNYIIKIL
jgi:hypothetical protein